MGNDIVKRMASKGQPKLPGGAPRRAPCPRRSRSSWSALQRARPPWRCASRTGRPCTRASSPARAPSAASRTAPPPVAIMPKVELTQLCTLSGGDETPTQATQAQKWLSGEGSLIQACEMGVNNQAVHVNSARLAGRGHVPCLIWGRRHARRRSNCSRWLSAGACMHACMHAHAP